MESTLIVPRIMSVFRIKKRETRDPEEALEFIKSNDADYNTLSLLGESPRLLEEQEDALKRIPQAFASNVTFKVFELKSIRIKNSLVAEALGAVLAHTNIAQVRFNGVQVEAAQIDLFCRAFRQRTMPVGLLFSNCPPELVNLILAIANRICYSLLLRYISCSNEQLQLKKLFFHSNLCRLSLENVDWLKDYVLLELSRCVSMMPGLVSLSFSETRLSPSVLKCVIGSMKANLSSRGSRLFQQLDLGICFWERRLLYYSFQLLESDFIVSFLPPIGASRFKTDSLRINIRLESTPRNIEGGSADILSAMKN